MIISIAIIRWKTRQIIASAIIARDSRGIIAIAIIQRARTAMAIRNAKDFGTAIRERRKRLGYTQGELAEMCDVGVMFVSQLENGKRRPSWTRRFAWRIWSDSTSFCKRGGRPCA